VIAFHPFKNAATVTDTVASSGLDWLAFVWELPLTGNSHKRLLLKVMCVIFL